ncbi:MAG: hypothetical protein EP314_01290 [Bacteroidetes bacterium]|nr:MAG: hypothetical protein EP314_01290 [Bacteroidota bacterium]
MEADRSDRTEMVKRLAEGWWVKVMGVLSLVADLLPRAEPLPYWAVMHLGLADGYLGLAEPFMALA